MIVLVLQASLLMKILTLLTLTLKPNQFKTNKKVIEYSTKLVSTDIGASFNQNCGLAFN